MYDNCATALCNTAINIIAYVHTNNRKLFKMLDIHKSSHTNYLVGEKKSGVVKIQTYDLTITNPGVLSTALCM